MGADRQSPRSEQRITLAHGAGGKASADLVRSVFLNGYGNPVLNQLGDAGAIPIAELIAGVGKERLALSTDSYVVNPVEFPGGNIGELAVNGTVNDLAVAGAVPKVLSAAFVLAEGLDFRLLSRVVSAMRRAADLAGVQIITGDTKVVPSAAADQMYITTTGVGIIPSERHVGPDQVRRGDQILVSGPIADHGMAVLLARGDLAINAPIRSDSRALNHLVEALFRAAPQTRWLRDATRGGVGTVANELAQSTQSAILLDEDQLPIQDPTRAACEMLGIDPLHVANEGVFLAVVPSDQAAAGLAALQQLPGGEQASLAGRVMSEPAGRVVLRTSFAGTRMVDMLVGNPLPRIC